MVGCPEAIVHLSSGLILKNVLFGLYAAYLNIDSIDSTLAQTSNTSDTGALFSSTKDDDIAERRKKLAESLRNGQEVVLDHSHIETDKNNGMPSHPPQYSMPPIQVPNGKLAGGIHPPIYSASSYCEFCGRPFLRGSKFCSYCGNPVTTDKKELKVSQVQFSAVVPKHIIKGEYSIIDIAVYEEEYRNIVDRIIACADSETKEIISSAQNVSENTSVRIKLSSPDMNIIDCDETQKWQGRYLSFSFAVGVSSDYEKKQILFIATVYFDDLIATRLKFVADCSSLKEQKIKLIREDVLTAFISYASQDRNRVATLIQGMKKARPDMDIFFDVDSLRSGDDWEKSLKREIEKRDVLFLCWSPFAKASKWVETEWRYALSINGIDSIEPVPLVSPSECPPPDELKSKHFNDRTLLYQERFSNNPEFADAHQNPRLMRQKTHEVIAIDKPVFRIGKEKSYVDYYIGDNSAISRSHSVIISKDNKYFIVDTNSTNHTYINGTIIPSNVETQIYHQTIIRLANEDFEFLLY